MSDLCIGCQPPAFSLHNGVIPILEKEGIDRVGHIGTVTFYQRRIILPHRLVMVVAVAMRSRLRYVLSACLPSWLP